MSVSEFQRPGCDQRRAVVIVQVLVLLTLLTGFAAFTVDIGTLYRARAELQNAADAAALSAATVLSSDAMLAMQLDDNTESQAVVLAEAWRRASAVSHNNYTLGSPTQIEPEDFLTGRLDLTSSSSPIDTTVSFDQKNSVQVTVRRYVGGLNGPVPYFFAPIFGRSYGETIAVAVASFDDRFAGLSVGPDGIDLLPIIVADSAFDEITEDAKPDHSDDDDRDGHDDDDDRRRSYKDKKSKSHSYIEKKSKGCSKEEDRGGGGRGKTPGEIQVRDDYDFDEDAGSVSFAADGIKEIKVLDDKMVPGNLGWVELGKGRHGSFGLKSQIKNGISDEDLQFELGTSDLIFYDDFGDPVTYRLRGVPGARDALVRVLARRIGEVVGVFTHQGVVGPGRNVCYQANGIRFVRVMASRQGRGRLDGGVWIQPVSYTGNDVIVNPGVPSSDGNAGRVVLAR